MGLYLSHPEDKLAWLKANATSFTPGELDQVIAGTKALPLTIPLALLHNPWGPTIAILFDRPEMRRFREGRPDAQFFLTERAKVEEYLP